ncbi:MAG TPA: ABC transporter ATP-binding protein [Acidimicrobiales bacterium]|nr:ABC transporter ATP-binding protein [Acidimicrobiales bacterium]
MTEAALEIRGLRVTYPGERPVRALDGIDLHVAPGECVGLLGESGSGKSTLAKALLGLLPEAEVEGQVHLDGLELTALDEDDWRPVRWRRIALAFQSTTALNPVLRVSDQLAEPLQVHLGMGRGAAERRAGELLEEVGLGAWALDRFPRELSGGQRRLALLAAALACDPEVLVLDEPTAGLDAVTRERVLGLLTAVASRQRTAMLIVSHDPDALAQVADRVAVLYRGWLAEVGPAGRVVANPRHPYAVGLLNARPTLGTIKELRGIRGDPPRPTEVATGCPFQGRCTQSVEACGTGRPAEVAPHGEDGRRVVSCIRGGLVSVLSATGLRKTYDMPAGVLRRTRVTAVDGVDLEVREGEVLGLVGPTGGGKSTVAKLLVRLLDADGGSVWFEGADLLAAKGPELKAIRRRLQLLFQDPYEALSPRLTVAEVVREPLDVQGIGTAPERDALVRETLAAVRLPAEGDFFGRRTHELSGGQLQRVALARALVLRPKLLVADEPVAMLDPSEQAKMLQLLKSLQVDRGMAMVLISHELAVVLRVCDRIIVLDHGAIVEEGTGSRLLVDPRHPVTRSMLRAAGRDELFPDRDGDRHREATGPPVESGAAVLA